MKNKVLLTVNFILLTAVLITFCVHGLNASADSVTGESGAQEKRDSEYMSTLTERPEVSFLEFKAGPFVKADELFNNYTLALNFVRLHSSYSTTPLTVEDVTETLMDIHPSAADLEQQIERMKVMRELLSQPEERSMEPVYYNDEPRIIEAGKQNLVEVPKVIGHAYLNGAPYAVVVRFDAFAGDGQDMTLYQGYMTLLKDEYTWGYYHCSGLQEIE